MKPLQYEKERGRIEQENVYPYITLYFKCKMNHNWTWFSKQNFTENLELKVKRYG